MTAGTTSGLGPPSGGAALARAEPEHFVADGAATTERATSRLIASLALSHATERPARGKTDVYNDRPGGTSRNLRRRALAASRVVPGRWAGRGGRGSAGRRDTSAGDWLGARTPLRTASVIGGGAGGLSEFAEGEDGSRRTGKGLMPRGRRGGPAGGPAPQTAPGARGPRIGGPGRSWAWRSSSPGRSRSRAGRACSTFRGPRPLRRRH